MGAPAEVLEEIFTVIEGGQSIGTSAEIIQFPSDNGARTFEAVNKTFKGSNGTGLNYWVAAVAQGASAISAGALFITVTIPEFIGLAVPCLGIAVGTAFYNIDPDGWTNLAVMLSNAGWTVKGKVTAFMTEEGIITIPPECIEILKEELCRLGVFDERSTWDGDKPETFTIEEPIVASTRMFSAELSVVSDYYYCGARYRSNQYEIVGFAVPGSYQDFKITSCADNGKLIGLISSKHNFSSYAYGFKYYPELSKYIHSATYQTVTNSFTYDNKTVYYADFDSDAGELRDTLGTNSIDLSTSNNIAMTAWIMQYGDFTEQKNPNLQKDAILPTQGEPFRTTYPDWLPWEFPELPGWTIPEVMPAQYPDLLPDTEPYQDPAQSPQADPDAEADKGIDKLQKPESNPDSEYIPEPGVKPDPDPLPEPGEEIDNPTGTETPNEPIDPDPEIPPSPIIVVPPLPDTVNSNKLFTVYNPSSSQLDALGGYLWDNDLIDILKKIWQNPLDGIISLSQVYATPVTGSNHNIILGYLDSGVSSPVVTQQFVTIDCGTVNIAELNENCLDYVPYTKMNVYLPFIGIVEIDGDEFMSGTVSIKYKVDTYTGTCLAEVKCTRNRDLRHGAILYTFSGNCSQQLPLTSGDAKGLFSTLLAGVGMLAGVASGGATAASFGSGMSALMSREMLHVGHSGSLSANAGIMGQKKPYLIISRERPYNANNYNKFYGYPTNKTVFPGNHSGFLRLKAGRLRTLATEEEKKEIMDLMMKGVIM